MSLPNQNSADGCRSRLTGSTACGSTVPSHGAKIATRTIANRTTPPTIAVGWRRNASRNRCHVGDTDLPAGMATALISVADARIEQHIADIHEQIDHYVRRREHQDHALVDRIVAAQNGIHRKTADARYGKHRFGDDCAADEERDAD